MKKFNEMKLSYKNEACSRILASTLKPFCIDDLCIVCIGTDKCIGDSLGPLVGTLLEKQNLPLDIYGTLDYPVHAINLKEKISIIKAEHPLSFIIAIDACLGKSENIGTIQVRPGPIYPGKGVGKSLPSIGNISIIGIIDCVDTENTISLHNVRLSIVMNMAETIVNGFTMAYNLNRK